LARENDPYRRASRGARTWAPAFDGTRRPGGLSLPEGVAGTAGRLHRLLSEWLLAEVAADRADLVIGSRYHSGAVAASGDYKPTFSRRIGISVFRFFLTLATRQRFTDTTSGMRAANRRVMALFSEHYSPDFAEIESLQLAVRQGLRVEELPVRMLERVGGTSFLTPLRSAFFIFKGLVVLLVGQFRPRHAEAER